jgi:predicted RNase H-like HicB family nuclease
MNTEIAFTRDESDWIIAEVPAMPGCVSQGRTEVEALANIQEAMTAWRWADESKKADPPPERF